MIYNYTFFDPANPSDSMKKYANGIATNKDKYEPRKIKFQNPTKKHKNFQK
jgi:hypothetical protein